MARRKNSIHDPKTLKVPPASNCLDFQEAIELFLKSQKILNRTPRTIQWHRENFSVLIKAFRAQNISLDLESITTDHLKYNFILYAMETWGNKPSTVNNRLKTYRSFWRFLTKEGYLKNDVARSIEKLREKKTVMLTLETTEIEAMLKICDAKTFTGLRDQAIMKTLLDTGIRLSELSGLCLSNINWNDSLIVVSGKGQKERLIPLSKELMKVLKGYIAERGQMPPPELFITLDNNVMSRRTIQERLEIIAEKAGVTKRASPHVWRHTFSKFYILNGGDPFTLKKILGHSDWAMVHRYVDMFASDIIKQHSKASPLSNL